jgi:hypothetical protein
VRIARSAGRGLNLILVVAHCLAVSPAADQGTEANRRALLRYALRPGDHLVYRQTLERQVRPSDPRSTAAESSSRVTWSNHVLVTGGEAARPAVGFQRNRVDAELLSYRQRGRDRLERERSRFEERLGKQGASFTEANLLSEDGRPALPWKAHRERISEVLPGLHEIEPLPTDPVGPGDQWPGTYPLGLTFHAVEWKQRGGESCLRIEGIHPRQDFRMGYRFCPRKGALDAAWFEGSYLGVQSRIADRWEIELVDARRGESLGAWLADPQLRLGALEALTAAETPPTDSAAVYALLEEKDTELRRRVLALAYRHRLPPLPAERLGSLLGSESPRVRVLAVRLRRGRGLGPLSGAGGSGGAGPGRRRRPRLVGPRRRRAAVDRSGSVRRGCPAELGLCGPSRLVRADPPAAALPVPGVRDDVETHERTGPGWLGLQHLRTRGLSR